ncbi:MAG: hypothetical protein P8L85_00995 [Rubripirellula sp.]|nr:hypothetical protein [Rubripirellula sp.]
MFDQDALHQRGKALEDEFFRQVDQKLLADLKASSERERHIEQLASVTSFQDDELLADLVDGGFQPATLAALALVPSVFVAWADGSVTPLERQAVMNTALHRGIEGQPLALQLLETWLHKHPPRSLWSLWKEYVSVVYSTFAGSSGETLANEIRQQARTVAEASGGTLGFGKVSDAEQEILDDIDSVFSNESSVTQRE